MLLPESLIVTWGLVRRPLGVGPRTAVLALLGLLTMAGDLILFCLPGRALVLKGREVFGLRATALPADAQAFVVSRPGVCAVIALVLAAASWFVAVTAIRGSARWGRDRPAEQAAPASGG